MKIALYNRDGDARIEPFKARLRNRGVTLVCCGEDFSSWSDLPGDVDLFLTLGGDGTFLRSLTFVRGSRIPVAGINFGRLGFLTTARAEDEELWIDDLLSGRFRIEERSLLKAECSDIPEEIYPYALNEISLQRNGAGVLSVAITIDGRELPAYWADGIVISTPTGSTAYNLSVGGPIVLPDSKVMTIVPIAPHNLNIRPLVVPITSVVEMTFSAREESARLTVDNRSAIIGSASRIRISKACFPLRYASLSDDSFISALRSKLLWGEDRRNSSCK